MNEETLKICQLDAGDRLGSELRGPHWTPYAEAIASHYPRIVPWYLSTTQVFTIAASPPVTTVVTSAYDHDVLIMGLSSTQFGGPLNINQVGFPYLNITDLRSNIPWVVPNTFAFAPLPAFTGFTQAGRTPVVKLPESFFLPRGTELKIDWIRNNLQQGAAAITVNLTLIGVQLIGNSPSFRAPDFVAMPNGDPIRVGSRMPWFNTLLFGRRVSGRAMSLSNVQLPIFQQAINYAPAVDCNVELHDAYASFLNNLLEYNQAADLLQVKLDATRETGDWTPTMTPVPAVFGSFFAANPDLPFVIPQLIKKGGRIQVVEQNNSSLSSVSNGTITFRGVRLCEY